MKTILLLGLGRSTNTLIKYLLQSEELNIKVVLADKVLSPFVKDYINYENCEFVEFNIENVDLRKKLILKSDLVVSMLPPRFHVLVANECVNFKKNLVTASYVSNEIQNLDQEAKKSNILILNEIGLDPGIDHISAMEVIDSLHNQDAKITTFKSFCGGLIAPESDNNPWNYKITWNPRNIILAGKDGATYLKDGLEKTFNYNEVFNHVEYVDIPNCGRFESYANRNSLHYKEKYNLQDAKTIVRGTIRSVGFCKAWNIFVQLGMTSETNSDFISKQNFLNYMNNIADPDVHEKMNYLDLHNSCYSNMNYDSSYSYLMNVLSEKWSLSNSDIDMIVMQHKFVYQLNGKNHKLNLSMVVKGEDTIHTGMAKTVGLPVFFACKLILQNKISLKGVRIPVYPEIYKPILKELSQNGIHFIRTSIS
tara:strand:- start:19219 stop:20484 length:1266 start_codon:yes stop_codon:yes gene_type:complete